MSRTATTQLPRYIRRTLWLLASGLATIVLLVVTITVLGAPTPPLPEVPARPDRLIIENVTVIDPDSGGRARLAQTVVIEHDRIVSVGTAGAPDALVATQRIDGRGKFLIPGLWDAHVHTLRLAPQLQLPLLIANGVTSVRDMGDSCSWSSRVDCASPVPSWRRSIAEGRIVGPRFVDVASYHLEEVPETDAALRRLLDALKSRGDRWVKLQLDPQVDSAIAHRVLRVADSLGLRVAGHLPFTIDLTSTPVPFESVEHDWTLLPQCSRDGPHFDDRIASKRTLLDSLDSSRCDRVLSAMRATGTAYTPTHVASTGQDNAFSSGPSASSLTARFIPFPQRAAWGLIRKAGEVNAPDAKILKDYHDAALRLTKRAHDAGVVVLAGSDALDPEVVHGFSLHEELQYLVRAGLSPQQALSTASSNPARFFGIEFVGRIAAGQGADLVLLNGDPLVDIANTRDIHTVIADGRVFGPVEREALLRFVEQQSHRVAIASRFLRGLWYSR
jgi:hypothetical protein